MVFSFSFLCRRQFSFVAGKVTFVIPLAIPLFSCHSPTKNQTQTQTHSVKTKRNALKRGDGRQINNVFFFGCGGVFFCFVFEKWRGKKGEILKN